MMRNLKQIWPSEITSGEEDHISIMRVVKVVHCESLVNLFPINPMPMLRNLEKLEVVLCDSLNVLFNIDLGGVGKTEQVRSSLRNIRVTHSMNLTEVWRMKGADNSQVSGFQAVENIYIRKCISFRHVFTPATTNFHMTALVDTDFQDFGVPLFQKALNSLHPNNKATKIALCGMGGVGKTRMMEGLVKAVKGMGMFDLVLKLVIGREANVIALQQATAVYIGEAITETAKETWADSLREGFMQISQGGKYNILVILDDLWKVLDLKDIGLPSSLPNGFKLLITSRDVNVCAQMGVENSSIFRLGVVDDAKAKTLFFENVGLLKEEDPDLYKIGEEIIIRCGNFPFTLETIASVLKGNIKHKSKWEETLSRLQNHNLEDIYDVLNIAFEMSYNNLKTDYEKSILFLCGLFPKYFDIPVEELTRYAWGLKLFPKVYTTASTLAQARHWIETPVDVLTYAKFLIKSDKVGCIKIQQLAYDFVLSKCTEVKQASFDHANMPEDADESYERLSLNCTSTCEFHFDFNHPNLKLLKIMGKKEPLVFPHVFYDGMKNLEVVSFERMVDPLLLLPSANLQTLCLHSCLLTYDFSFLGNLINVEILSFAHCGIQKLPFTIAKLRKLKLLDVTGCVDLSIEDGVFRNLVNLEELYMRADSESRIRFTDANYEELEILLPKLSALEVEFYENKLHEKNGSFEKLKKFKISIGCQLNDFSDELFFRNILKLVTNRSELVECKFNKFNKLFEKTERLYLQVMDMKNLEEVFMHYSFCNLRELEVCHGTDLTYLFTVEVVSGLTNLERLEVSKCPVLETLIHGESGVMGIVFLKLKFLYLEELPCLMSLCDSENIRVELQQLVELQLRSLPNFTSIYHDDAMQTCAFFNNQVQHPKLEVLSFLFMEKLKQIWPSEITNNGGSEKDEVNNNNYNNSVLRKITVWGCDSLENLFPSNPLPLLNHLEKLTVFDSCSIQVLFNMDLRGAGAANMYQLRSSLRQIDCWHLENLREIWRVKGGISSLLPISCFQAVEELIIRECRRFRDIFAPKNINFDFRAGVIR